VENEIKPAAAAIKMNAFHFNVKYGSRGVEIKISYRFCDGRFRLVKPY
jgi:hypothetical protein